MLQVRNEADAGTVLLPEDRSNLQGQVSLRGTSGSRFEIGAGTISSSLYADIGPDCRITIGKGCNLGNLFIYTNQRCEVSIGDGVGINGLVRLLLHEPGRISIGDGCLFAGEVDVTVSDMHSIVDAATGERINPARDVTVEDRVWVGQRAMLLKGAHIGPGSIIGACSVVSGRLPGNCVAAGTPAKVLRSGVTWRHDLI